MSVAARATNTAFVSIVDAPHVRPGWLLCSVADLYKTDWEVMIVASRVADRFLEVTMRPAEGGKPITRTLDRNDTIARKISKDWVHAQTKKQSDHGKETGE